MNNFIQIRDFYLSSSWVRDQYHNLVYTGATGGDFIAGASFYKDYNYYSKNHLNDGVAEEYKQKLGYKNAIPEHLTGDFSRISLKNRFQMSLIFGPTGSGKTARILQNMSLQDLTAANFEHDGLHITQLGQLLIDPKADYALAMKYAGIELKDLKRTQYLESLMYFLTLFIEEPEVNTPEYEFVQSFLDWNIFRKIGNTLTFESLTRVMEDWATFPLFQLVSALHLLRSSYYRYTPHMETIQAINPSYDRDVMNVFDPLMSDSPFFNPMRGSETTVVASITKTLMSMSGFSDPNNNPHFYNASKRALEYALKMVKRTYEDYATLQHVYSVLFNLEGRKILASFEKRNNRGVFNRATTEENNNIIRFFSQDYFNIQENQQDGNVPKNNPYTDSTGARDSIEKMLSNPYMKRILNPDSSEENVIDLDDLLMYGDKLAVGLEGGSMGDTTVSNALGQLIVLQFQDAVLRRPLVGRLPFIFVIDEFQQYASPEIKELLNQGRSYKVASHFATQSSEVIETQGSTGKQILANIVANTRNKIYLTGTQSHHEAKTLSDNFGFTSFKTLVESLSEKDGKKGGSTVEVIGSIGGVKSSSSFSIKEHNNVPIVPPAVFQGGPYSYEKYNSLLYPSKVITPKLRELYPKEVETMEKFEEFSVKNGGGNNFTEGLILLSTATEQTNPLGLSTSTMWTPYWLLDYQKTEEYIHTYQLTNMFHFDNKTEPEEPSEEEILELKTSAFEANQKILPPEYQDPDKLKELRDQYHRNVQEKLVASRKPIAKGRPSIIDYYNNNLPVLDGWKDVVAESQEIAKGLREDYSKDTLSFIHNNSILEQSHHLLDSIDSSTLVKDTLTSRLYYALHKQVILNHSLDDKHLNKDIENNMIGWFYSLNEIIQSNPGDTIVVNGETHTLTVEDIAGLVEIDEEEREQPEVATHPEQEPDIDEFELNEEMAIDPELEEIIALF